MMKRVLIVDDNTYVRDLIHTFLKHAPEIEICGEAINGVEAIEKAKQLEPDVVLLDLAMPTMNGVETAAILKKTIPGVTIIMFTMYSENIPKSAISSMGVDLVLSKTDGITHLAESINTAFAARASGHPPSNPA
jgi:DNA-binding NarL/FixJ family response regulator